MQSINNSAIKPPCGKVCENRQLGCHSYCEKYKEYLVKKEEINKKIRKQKDLEETLTSISISTFNKIKKQRNIR